MADLVTPITRSAPAMAATPRNAMKLNRAKHANGSTSKSNKSRFTASLRLHRPHKRMLEEVVTELKSRRYTTEADRPS
jgi:hypothetical protein